MDHEHGPCVFPTPWGTGTLRWGAHGITSLHLGTPLTPDPTATPTDRPQWITDALTLLARYLEGHDVALHTIPVDLHAATAFAQRVYRATQAIPRGTTRTYLELAEQLRMPHGARAVGQALKRNPIPLIVPCHRVVATHGLGGFTAPGGVHTKQQLLALEQLR